MKSLLKTLHLSLIAMFVLFAVGCSSDDNNDGGTTEPPVEDLSIYETAVASSDLTILVEALERTGLDATLNDPGTYTVFAPTNDAFTAAGISLDDFSDEELTNLLLNHVLGSEVMSGDLTTTYVNTLATGPNDNNISLYVNTDGGVTFNGVSSPVSDGLDIGASNGVIHLIDTPLAIPNVVNHVVANPDFQTLEDAVLSFENELTDILTADGPYTIFAPSNEAFEDLFATLGTTEVDPAVLRTVLLYHVVVGVNAQSGDLTDGQELEMGIDGEILTVDLSDGAKVVDGTGNAINITTTDIQGSNGVIHEVDQVLLPPSIVEALAANATIYQLAKFTPGYSTLAAAIEQAGLVEALNAPDADLTVFAPDDAAFAAFLEANEISSLADVDNDLLTAILLNHAISGQLTAADVVGGGNSYASTLATTPEEEGANLSLYINTDDGVTLNGSSNVIATDVEVSNGIVHLVDAVIELPTVVTFATVDPNFNVLASALTRVDGSAGYVATLQTAWGTDPAPFTVFAPTNNAFADLITELNIESLDDLDDATVTSVLSYHVIGGANVRSDQVTAGPVSTLGGEVTLGTDGGVTITDANDRVSTVVAADVQAYNGVIHAIDTVILPPQ